MNPVKKFFRLSGIDKRIFIEAILLCTFIKLIVLMVPIKKYQRFLGKRNVVFDMTLQNDELVLVYRVSAGIIRSRKFLPWESKCLTEAIVAKQMLKKRNIESTLYLGVIIAEGKMAAHAWLKCGEVFITGRKGSGKFTVVSTFA